MEAEASVFYCRGMAGAFRCPTLVGRQPALDLVDGLLAGVHTERGGGCLVVIGEPGVGKSRVVAEAMGLATSQSLTVLPGRASVVSSGASMRPIAEAVARYARSNPDPPGSVGAYLPVLARFVPEWQVPIGPEGDPILVGEALVRLADGQANGALLVLEDLHWADPDTLRVLEYLADSDGNSGLAVLATSRPPEGDLARLIDGLGERGSAQVHRLPRLSDDNASVMAAGCLGLEGPLPPTVHELVAAAEGLPLLVEDLLADAVARHALRREDGTWVLADTDRGVPASFAETVVVRLSALDDTTAGVLHAAAVLGRDFDDHLLGSVLGLATDSVAAALVAAEREQLVERVRGTGAVNGYRFRHALTREAVLAEVPAQQRVSLASAAADACGVAGMPAHVVASLLTLAARGDEAAALLVEAAAAERQVGTNSAALGLLARARSLAKDPDLAQRVVLAQVRVMAESGLSREAHELAREVLPFLGSDQARAIRLRLAGSAIRAQDPLAARSQLDIVKAVGDLHDAEWAEVWSLEASLALSGTAPERITEAEHLAHRAVAAAKRARLPAVECESLLVLGRCSRLRDLAAAEDAFRDAFRVADGASLAVQRVSALAELGTVQMLREVRADTLLQAREGAEVLGAPVTAVGISVNVAGVRIMRGELDQAIAESRAAQEAARRLGLTGALAATIMFEAISEGFSGRSEEMERLLAEAEATGHGEPDILAGSWAIGRATVALLDEDRPKAIRALERANAIINQSTVLMIDPAAGPSALLAAVEGRCTSDDIDEAETRSGAGSAWTRMWIGCARSVLAGINMDRVPEDFSRDGLAAASRYPVFGLVAARIVAEAQVRDGWGEPVQLLTDIERRARDRGYRRVAVACRSLLRSAGVRVPRRRTVDLGLGSALQRLGITAREAEVLDLLRERLTTPEIAGRLFLSPRTVEKHVASLLAKTGATGRSQLAEIASNQANARFLGGRADREGG